MMRQFSRSAYFSLWVSTFAAGILQFQQLPLVHSLSFSHMDSHQKSIRLFLDTADVEVWRELLPLGIFHGVTTNPTLLEQARQPCTVKNIHSMAQTALTMTDEFMCQTWGEKWEDMYVTGMQLSQPDRKRIVVKVPVTKIGTQAGSELIKSGVRICLTACYNSQQAIVAAGLGADYLAPYLGRMTDAGKDGMAEVQKMEKIVRNMGSDTRILVASIRSVNSMTELMTESKMDTFTFNPEVARDLFRETLTDTAAKVFEEAAQNNMAP